MPTYSSMPREILWSMHEEFLFGDAFKKMGIYWPRCFFEAVLLQIAQYNLSQPENMYLLNTASPKVFAFAFRNTEKISYQLPFKRKKIKCY